MATRKNEPTTEQQNQELTPLQLRFIELLLAGKSITDAARTIGVSRRAACNWLDPAHAVHQEYEQQRRALAYDLQERVKQVHELAMKALKDFLISTKRPDLRFQAMKLVYESHLRDELTRPEPASSEHLVRDELDRQINPSAIAIYLYDDRGRPRIHD